MLNPKNLNDSLVDGSWMGGQVCFTEIKLTKPAKTGVWVRL